MPFSEMKDSDKMEKARAFRESYKKANLGPDNIPSICMYSLMNVSSRVTTVNISDDSSLVAAGFSDSIIKVGTLLPHKLRKLTVDQTPFVLYFKLQGSVLLSHTLRHLALVDGE